MLPAPFTNALVLTGPTGSGKTRLGIDLAGRLDAEIVSMDSMAVYRRMDIGTAKPTAAERGAVPHHLVDVLEPWESASVAWWLRAALAACRDIEGRGKRVLFVGGTPLYLKALMFGLFDGPPADAALRERLTNEAVTADLHARLAHVDAATAARLHPNDTRRIIRALEVFELTGRPISAWQTQWRQSAVGSGQEAGDRKQEDGSGEPADADLPSAACQLPTACCFWLDLPRPALYHRIDRRVDEMFAAGLVEEVRTLSGLEKPLGAEARQALGYKEVLEMLTGRTSLEETVALVKRRTRNFAKRQITWFRHLPGCMPATPELTETLWASTM